MLAVVSVIGEQLLFNFDPDTSIADERKYPRFRLLRSLSLFVSHFKTNFGLRQQMSAEQKQINIQMKVLPLALFSAAVVISAAIFTMTAVVSASSDTKIERVKSAPTSARAWIELCNEWPGGNLELPLPVALPTDQQKKGANKKQSSVPTKSYTQRLCYETALTLDPKVGAHSSYYNLASLMIAGTSEDRATIAGKPFSRIEILSRACDAYANVPAYAPAFLSLGKELRVIEQQSSKPQSVEVRSAAGSLVKMNRLDLFVRAAEIDPGLRDVWSNIGATLEAKIGSFQFPKLAVVSIDGIKETYTSRRCFEMELQAFPTHDQAWSNAAIIIEKSKMKHITVDDKKYYRHDCLAKAIEHGAPSTQAQAWHNLGAALAPTTESDSGKSVKVAGKKITAKHAFAKAIEHDISNNGRSWFGLSVFLNGADSTAVLKLNDKKVVVTSRDCLIKAVEASEAKWSDALNNLGAALNHTEKIVVNVGGKPEEYSKLGLFVAAVNAGSGDGGEANFQSWRNVANMLKDEPENHTIELDGGIYTAKEIMKKADELEDEYKELRNRPVRTRQD